MKRLPDGSWVNPDNVCSIFLDNYSVFRPGGKETVTRTAIEVIGNEGYRTRKFLFDGDRRDEFGLLLGGEV